jgi:hypothetical protein
MKIPSWLPLALVAVAPLTLPLPAAQAAQTFQEYLDTALADPARPLHPSAADAEYVFIGGFLNEGLHGYFADNIRALTDAGVPRARIHELYPSSAQTVEENVPWLSGRLGEVTGSSQGRKLIVTGHSKGGAEMLAVAMAHPEWIRESVLAVYLVQAAIGGSGVADSIKGENAPWPTYRPHVPDSMPLSEVLFVQASRAGAAHLLDPIVSPGMASLTHSYASAFWEKWKTRTGPVAADVDAKIRYIQGAQHPSKMAEAIDCTGWYLHDYFHPENDGLVTLPDQSLEGVGSVVARLDADHADLMTPWPVSNEKDPRTRRALMNAVTWDARR